MTRHKSVRAPQQASFLEAMLLEMEKGTTPVELPTALPKEDSTPSAPESPAPKDATRDLFGFIVGLEPHATKDFWTQPLPVGKRVFHNSFVASLSMRRILAR